MGSGYKKLYEGMKRQKEQLEKLVEAQDREIVLLEKEVELYEEMEEQRSKQVEALKALCCEQEGMLRKQGELNAER